MPREDGLALRRTSAQLRLETPVTKTARFLLFADRAAKRGAKTGGTRRGKPVEFSKASYLDCSKVTSRGSLLPLELH